MLRAGPGVLVAAGRLTVPDRRGCPGGSMSTCTGSRAAGGDAPDCRDGGAGHMPARSRAPHSAKTGFQFPAGRAGRVLETLRVPGGRVCGSSGVTPGADERSSGARPSRCAGRSRLAIWSFFRDNRYLTQLRVATGGRQNTYKRDSGGCVKRRPMAGLPIDRLNLSSLHETV